MPSVISRSGAKVRLARRAPIAGTVPKLLARISPSPRKASATADGADLGARESLIAAASRQRARTARW